MATCEKKECLTPRQIVRLAAAISANNMAAIAEGYMDIPSERSRTKSMKTKMTQKDLTEKF